MQTRDSVECSVCSGKVWKITGTRIYRKDDQRWTRKYRKLQKTVFFDLWHNKMESVKKERLLCTKCGFVTDAARPDENDISAKYEFLSKEEKFMGAMREKKKSAILDENRQSLHLMNLANTQRKSRDVLDVLDYGGGDGHFLLPFRSHGHSCFVVDYNVHPVPEIRHIGKDLEDLDKKHSFDLIVCRHVLEHVANPKKILNGFKGHLKKNAMVFIEVPIELLSEKDPATDPVTHINFFQEKSLGILFRECGYTPLVERKMKSKYHGNFRLVAQVLAIASENKNEKNRFKESYRYTEKLIHTSKHKKRLSLLWNDPIKFIKEGIRKIFR